MSVPCAVRIAAAFLFSFCLSRATLPAQQSALPANPGANVSSNASLGSVTGIVFDPNGAAIAGAAVSLTSNPHTSAQKMEVVTGPDGWFTFSGVQPGPFHLVVRNPAFSDATADGELAGGGVADVPAISLALAPATSDVVVKATDHDLAAEQIKMQEAQQLFGAIPNFYVSYVPDAVPLTPRQKFSLAWKQAIDPASFVITGVIAGAEQAANGYKGYGQGTEGYAKRYGAAYADFFSGTMIGSAILPSLFRQDPRYFYKGIGTVRSRTFYAIANSVVCKGDNRHWQVNYSNILGGLAAGGISNLYYPAADRNGAALTFENAAIGIGAQAAANLLQEFLFRRLTLSHRRP